MNSSVFVHVLVLFFFKQKTAYEMRISDWSSDVCSSDLARHAIDAVKGCVTPIFDVNEKREAELLGSAVLIEIAEEFFLCTAKHVIDDNKDSTLYTDGPAEFAILEGDFYASQEHDIAVLKLTEAQRRTFKKYKPLRADDIANQTQAAASKYAEFVGFPETRNRKVYKQNKIAGEIYAIGGMILEVTTARIRVAFNRKRNIAAATRKRVTSPDPHGMSGGASSEERRVGTAWVSTGRSRWSAYHSKKNS